VSDGTILEVPKVSDFEQQGHGVRAVLQSVEDALVVAWLHRLDSRDGPRNFQMDDGDAWRFLAG
jgi:hypothetical protein